MGGKRVKALLKPDSCISTFRRNQCASVNSSFVKLPMSTCSVLSLKYHFPYLFLLDLRRKDAPFFPLLLPSPHGHFNLTDCAAERDGGWQDVPPWGLCISGIYFPGLV